VASDDGKPEGSSLTVSWSKLSGPGTVTFANPNAAPTTAAFSVEGTYVLQLTASDSLLTSSSTVTVLVHPCACSKEAGARIDVGPPPPLAAFNRTGDVVRARHGHTMTRLLDGR